MQSNGNFSQLFTQVSEAFSSVDSKTKSLKLVDVNYMSEEEFMLKIQQMSNEIPLFKTILKYRDLFTLYPQPQLILSMIVQNWSGVQIVDEIGIGANAKVFLSSELSSKEIFAIKFMEKVNINMLEFYIQECINQYDLIQIKKDFILNFKGQVYINISNSQASIYIPLELAEYSLFEYIQSNEITQEIYQHFYSLLIDMLVLLHSNNYAHRDIKPQNILFIKGQGWKLADFGESIKYEQRQDLFKIQGTLAFLPTEIRKQINIKHKQIYQDLFKNDLYAVICTLVMVKNPQFKPKDLINYMDKQEFDQNQQYLFQILEYKQPFNELSSITVPKQQMNLDIFKIDKIIFNTLKFKIEHQLILHYLIGTPIDQKHLNHIDDQLETFKQENKQDQQLKLQFYFILLYPLQVHQLKNFNSQLLTHKEIINNSRFYLQDEIINCIYFNTFQYDCELVKHIIFKALQEKNKFMILFFIGCYIKIGYFQLAQDLLQIIGKIMVTDINFDSELFFAYNSFYFQIHNKALSFDENYLEQNYPQITDYKQIQSQFNLQQYLNEDKFLNKDIINLILLFYPLFPRFELDYQTLNIVFKHIIETLKLSEFEIIDDRLIVSNIIKSQLIKGGYKQYKSYINELIAGIAKFFQNYDQFEGLFDLLHYFLYFMKFMDTLTYFSIISLIQKLIFQLNFPIYHIKEDIDVLFSDIKSKQTKTYHLKTIQLTITIQKNQLLFNIIQDMQKTELSKINDNQQLIRNLLIEAKIRQSIITFNEQKIYLQIKQYAQLYSYIQQQNQKYLSVLVLMCRYLCGDSIDQQQINFKINREKIKFQFDPILLQYYILCKQNKRINELFIDWKKYENLKLLKNTIFKPLSDIVLMRKDYLIRINTKFDFIYLQSLSRFVANEKYRSFFNFKQHLSAANISKQIKKRLIIHNIILKEQFLGII